MAGDSFELGNTIATCYQNNINVTFGCPVTTTTLRGILSWGKMSIEPSLKKFFFSLGKNFPRKNIEPSLKKNFFLCHSPLRGEAGCLGGSVVGHLPLAQVVIPGQGPGIESRIGLPMGTLLLPLPMSLPLSLFLSVSHE